MFRFFLFIFIALLSFSTLANRVFTPINNAKIVHGQGATVRNLIGAGNTLAGRTRVAGAVTTGGRFAVATINPASALALGKQLAKSHPFAIAAMAALTYYSDDINQWFLPAELEGDAPSYTPENTLGWAARCETGGGGIDVAGFGQPPLETAIRDDCGPQLLTLAESNYKSTNTLSDGVYIKSEYSDGKIFITKHHPDIDWDLGGTNYPVVVDDIRLNESKQCPPSSQPSYVQPVFDGDGNITECLNPEESAKYSPQPVTTAEMAPPYADDLMQFHNESINDLNSWDPYLDGSGNIEPEYVSSYNQPNVSDEMNNYMQHVASGNFQSTSASSPSYVPADMVQPTQTAINATFNNDPFVDPTTSTVVEPASSTEGAATAAPSPTGMINDPLHVTGNFTVDVQIPEDDTISQTEYEASNAKFFEQFDTQAQLEQTKIDTKLEDLKTQDSDFIDSLTPDITNFAVPDFPTLASIWPSFSTGNCIALVLPASVGGLQQNITFDAHCPPYNTYIHPLLVWLLYMATGLYVFHLAHETLGRK